MLAEVPSDFDEELPIIITTNKEVNQLGSFAATVFPNPAENQLRIGAELQKAGRVTFSLFNTSGALLITQNKTAFSSGWNYWDISLDDFSAGLYLLRLQTDEGVSTLKIVKQ